MRGKDDSSRCWCSRWDRDTEALQAKIGTLSLEAQEKLDKDTAKKEAKAEAKADAALKKKMVQCFLGLSQFWTGY